MIKTVFLSLVTLSIAGFSAAQAEAVCPKTETACVLDAVWGAALVLPEEKQARVKPMIVEAAVRSGDDTLVSDWAGRFGIVAQPLEPMDENDDYGWRNARDLIATGGVDALIETARAKRAPLSYGRSDALLAAGKHYLGKDAVVAKRLNDELIFLARGASDFEKSALAHAAAELAMQRCDAATLSAATAMTDAPTNLRYDFWRARVKGGAVSLVPRITDEADDEDTRHVRQALDGYRAIQELGYCVQP